MNPTCRLDPLYDRYNGKYEPNIVFYEQIVADITTRNEELKIAWSHHIWFYFYVFLHLLLFTKRYRNKKCIECVFLPKQKILGQQQFKTNTMYFVENAMYRSTEKESSCRSRNQQTLLFPQKIILINFLTVRLGMLAMAQLCRRTFYCSFNCCINNLKLDCCVVKYKIKPGFFSSKHQINLHLILQAICLTKPNAY
jgi:hypothetical protein